MEDFDRWSNKKKEQEAFAKWSDNKASAAKLMQPAQPVATNYSAPFYGAGDSARSGVERTQPAQPEKKTTPINQRNKITLHPGVEKVDAAARAAQSQKQSTPTPATKPQAKAPTTPTGQALRLGELSEPPQKPFTFSDSPQAEMPKNRFAGAGATLPGWQAKSGMAPPPATVNGSSENLLAGVSKGAYTDIGDVVKQVAEQVALGNYSDDVTALGTLAQLALSMAGLDLPMDIRDLTYDLTNWEWTGEHLFQTLTDAVGFLPLVGSLKYMDEAADLLGSADEFGALAKGAGKLGDTLGSMDEAVDLLENAPEMADLLKGVPESGDLLGSTDELIKGVGDYSNLAEKAKNIDVSTSAHQAVFYSGAGNRAQAEAFATLNGKTTLEMTPGGKYFESLKLFDPGSPITDDQALEIWKILSERYAKAASGNVYGFVKGSNPGSIFNTVEYQALQKNPYIANIFTELLN